MTSKNKSGREEDNNINNEEYDEAELLSMRLSRRAALGTGAKVAIGTALGLVIGGIGGYLALSTQAPAVSPTTIVEKVTEKVTVTVPATSPTPTVTTVTTTPTPTTVTTATTPTTVTTALPFKHGKKIIYLTPQIEEIFWVACKEYLRRAVEADGWQFAFDCAEGSESKLHDQIVTYATQCDALFVFPISKAGVNEAVKIAQEEHHCPVILCKNFSTAPGRFNIGYNDKVGGRKLVELAINWLKEKYGTTKDKTIVSFSGSYKSMGWFLRATGVKEAIDEHPEVNFVELLTGGTVAGWAESADTYFSANTADAILSASDGPYFKGVLDALDRYGQLYYVGDPNHIFVATIDGKPSQLQWIRRAYVDAALPQPIDAMFTLSWELAKKYIIKDASYQYPPYPMPEIPVPLEVSQPEGCYWGGKDVKMTIDRGLAFPGETEMPQGLTPVYVVTKDNVNNPDIWGNKYTFWKGKEPIQDLTWRAKGTPPDWSQQVLREYEKMFWEYYGKR